MTAKRKFNLIWLLLPFLLVRGLVPAGFMVDASSGSLAIVMCGGDGPLKAAALNEHSGHAMHGASMDRAQHHAGEQNSQTGNAHHGSGHDKHKSSICPFAIAGSTTTLANTPSLPGLEPIRIFEAADAITIYGLSGPSRVQQSRAPPYFS